MPSSFLDKKRKSLLSRQLLIPQATRHLMKTRPLRESSLEEGPQSPLGESPPKVRVLKKSPPISSR